MAIVAATQGLTPKAEWDSRRAEKARARNQEPEDIELTPEEQEKYRILKYCSKTFDAAQKARRPFETFDLAWALFNGDMWSERRAPWRASITINKIRAFITFMQAVMTDNKPRVSVEPDVPGSEKAADLLSKLVDRDWDENNMQSIISLWVLYGLIWGYAFVKVTYDPFANGGRGKHCAVVVPPYRIYTNQTATCIEDAEYIIHVEDMTMGWVRRNFPKKAELVNKIRGLKINDRSDQNNNRDLVREGSIYASTKILSAMNVNGNIVSPQAPMSHPPYHDDDNDTVQIAEYWIRDDRLESYERQVVLNGEGQFEPVIENGLYVMQTVGTKMVTSEIDGTQVAVPVRKPKMQPKMETAWRRCYPNGRLVVIAGGRVLLRDIPNPFQTDGFPFAMWKDYDVGGFHGQGEPLTLKSCAIAVNKLASQVFEILEKVGNPSWKLKKGGGVNAAAMKNKPGLVIPMDDMDSIQPLEKPPIPPEFFKLYDLVSNAMGEVSGVNEAVKGALPAANTAFATMDQLQESGAAPIRLKVRNLETGIARIGKLRIQLIQQYDQGDRPLRVTNDQLDPGVVTPVGEARTEFRKYTNVDLQGQVDFGIVPISSLSTSPAGLWNKWQELYAKHLVDRAWWHKKFRLEGYSTELPRMEKQEALDAQQQAAAKDKSKPGPAPKKAPQQARRGKPAPPTNNPSRLENASVR